MPRILLIDDEEDVRLSISENLKLAGYQVALASGGTEGIRRSKSECFDLVVTDILMPEKEGIETIMEIRETNSSVPIIAISGGGQFLAGQPKFLDDVLVSAEIFGANYSLAKPFQSNDLLNLVEKALAENG